MSKPSARRVVAAYLAGLKSTSGLSQLDPNHPAMRVLHPDFESGAEGRDYLHQGWRSKTAGEVRHVKDNSGDSSAWAFQQGPMEREMLSNFDWDSTLAENLARVLRSTTASLGHAINAQNSFAKMKSRTVSPDGRLGGKGYIQRIADMRRQFFNVVEALSALSDTLYDEIKGPHWTDQEGSGEAGDIIEHTETIREDPAGWADEEISEDEEERV